MEAISTAIERINIANATFVRQFIVRIPRRECKITRCSQSYDTWYLLTMSGINYRGSLRNNRDLSFLRRRYRPVMPVMPEVRFLNMTSRRCVRWNATISPWSAAYSILHEKTVIQVLHLPIITIVNSFSVLVSENVRIGGKVIFGLLRMIIKMWLRGSRENIFGLYLRVTHEFADPP